MVADCNDIFDGGDGGSRNGVGITQFGTNGKHLGRTNESIKKTQNKSH